jgi:hypothetical protein
MNTHRNSVSVGVLASIVLVACADRTPVPHAELGIRPLVTRYEGTLSAPLGPAAEVVARDQRTWDSSWRALQLPGTPPDVDFARELAVLKVTRYGSSPFTYSSSIERANLDATSRVLTVYVRVRHSEQVVDTSSRKVVAAAIRSDSADSPAAELER